MSTFQVQSEVYVFKNRIYKCRITGETDRIKKYLLELFFFKKEKGSLEFLTLENYSAIIDVILNFLSVDGRIARETTLLSLFSSESYLMLSVYDNSFSDDEMRLLKNEVINLIKEHEHILSFSIHMTPSAICIFIKPILRG